MSSDEHRNRVDSAVSKDSGIDVRVKRPRQRRILSNAKGANLYDDDELERKWDVDNILWIIVFAATAWCFRLPNSIWFSPKTDWGFMCLAGVFLATFLFLGVIMLLRMRTLIGWSVKTPKIFKAAWMCFIFCVICFCMATFEQFGWWSLYIIVVSFMALVSLAKILS